MDYSQTPLKQGSARRYHDIFVQRRQVAEVALILRVTLVVDVSYADRKTIKRMRTFHNTLVYDNHVSDTRLPSTVLCLRYSASLSTFFQ